MRMRSGVTDVVAKTPASPGVGGAPQALELTDAQDDFHQSRASLGRPRARLLELVNRASAELSCSAARRGPLPIVRVTEIPAPLVQRWRTRRPTAAPARRRSSAVVSRLVPSKRVGEHRVLRNLLAERILLSLAGRSFACGNDSQRPRRRAGAISRNQASAGPTGDAWFATKRSDPAILAEPRDATVSDTMSHAERLSDDVDRKLDRRPALGLLLDRLYRSRRPRDPVCRRPVARPAGRRLARSLT